MDNTVYSHELEEMREQVAILKKKLDKQTIISDTHIRNSMTSKRSDMTRTITSTIIAGLFAVPYCTWIFCKFGFSPYFIIATDIMLAVCIGITIRQRYTLMNLNFTQGNLVEVAEKLNKVKTHYHEWIKIAIPMLLIWVSWMAYEALTRMEPSPTLMGFLPGAGIGIIIGGFIGHRINQKIVRKSTEILKQIEELQKD
jgi:predicted small secreted protein